METLPSKTGCDWLQQEIAVKMLPDSLARYYQLNLGSTWADESEINMEDSDAPGFHRIARMLWSSGPDSANLQCPTDPEHFQRVPGVGRHLPVSYKLFKRGL